MKLNHEFKLQQRNRIEKLNNKKKYLKVFWILSNNNENLKYTENNNGIFLRYDNLYPKTYKEVEKFLDDCDKHRIKINIKPVNLNPSKSFEDLDSEYEKGRLRFTAKEKSILKAKKTMN
jgi:predicted MPP superfamily phosphohydrolase